MTAKATGAWKSPGCHHFFKIMKLNDLPPLDQAEIIANRIANMDALREHAFNLFVARNPFPLGKGGIATIK